MDTKRFASFKAVQTYLKKEGIPEPEAGYWFDEGVRYWFEKGFD